VIERLVELTAHRTDVRSEVVAGITTFLAMAYIIFVLPAVLSAAGMDFGAVMVATCLASGLATLLMGLLANYPIAVAPAMGHNFYFAFTVCVAMHVPWQTALGAVAIAGLIFILMATVGLRERLIVVIPALAEARDGRRHRPARRVDWIAVGRPDCRLSRHAGHARSLVCAGNAAHALGLIVVGILLARAIPGALLIGMLASNAQRKQFGRAG
jgi:AGZA family xanthine/uracil permease-like MFS transporter